MSRKLKLFSSVLAFIAAVPFTLHVVANFEFLPVMNASMAPNYMVGDLQITKPVDARDLIIGDVVVVKNALDSVEVSRRIMSIEELENEIVLQTKGDNNAGVDQVTTTISKVSTLSKVIANAPKLGLVIDALAVPGIVYAGLFVILLLILVAINAMKNRKGRQ